MVYSKNIKIKIEHQLDKHIRSREIKEKFFAKPHVYTPRVFDSQSYFFEFWLPFFFF